MKRPLNTRQGGHFKETRMRQVVANPEGNREQRRAAAKLARSEERPTLVFVPPRRKP